MLLQRLSDSGSLERDWKNGSLAVLSLVRYPMPPRFVFGPLSPTQGPKSPVYSLQFTTKVKVEPKVKVIFGKTLLRSDPIWIWENGFQKNHSIMYGVGVPQRMPGKILLTVPTPFPSKISYI